MDARPAVRLRRVSDVRVEIKAEQTNASKYAGMVSISGSINATTAMLLMEMDALRVVSSSMDGIAHREIQHRLINAMKSVEMVLTSTFINATMATL